MPLSSFSYILGLLELLVGIPMLLKPEETTKWLCDVLQREMLLRIVGAVIFIMAFLALVPDASLGSDVAGIMRFIAWLALIKGLLFCWFPVEFTAVREAWFRTPGRRLLSGLLMCTFGVMFLGAGSALA